MEKFFSQFHMKGCWWFRIFGVGLACKDTTQHRLMFSERTLGHKFWHILIYGKQMQIGKYRIQFLTKYKY